MVSVNFYLNHPKAKGKLKDHPVLIYGLVSKEGHPRFYIETDERIHPTLWDSKKQRAKSKEGDSPLINEHLSNLELKILKLYRENRDKSWIEFENLCTGQIAITDEKKTFRYALDAFIKQWEQDKAQGTVERFYVLKAHLYGRNKDTGRSPRRVIGFVEQHGPIDFHNLDLKFYDAWKSFLYEKGLIDSTVYKLTAHIKTVLRWAEEREYPVNPVYRKFKIISHDPEPISLTLEEIEKLKVAILPKGPSLGRDVLLFACLVGQRISDILRFDVKNYNPETLEWTFPMKKGESIQLKKQTVILDGYCAYALEILERHKMAWPKVAAQTINEWIKEAAEIAGITQIIDYPYWLKGKRVVERVRKCDILSTHYGRKSFLTHASAHFHEADLKALSGIKNSRTLKHYVSTPDNSRLRAGLINMQSKMKAS